MKITKQQIDEIQDRLLNMHYCRDNRYGKLHFWTSYNCGSIEIFLAQNEGDRDDEIYVNLSYDVKREVERVLVPFKNNFTFLSLEATESDDLPITGQIKCEKPEDIFDAINTAKKHIDIFKELFFKIAKMGNAT